MDCAGLGNPLRPCCTGVDGSHLCGEVDEEERPLYKVCEDVGKAVMFDYIHPTERAWEVVVNLYAGVAGFTQEGPELQIWIKRYGV